MCCFNNFAKVTPRTLELWAKVLAAVPSSRLLIKTRAMADGPTRQRALDILATLGVAPGRVELCPFTTTYAEHLAVYGRVDIALDCFPYNGTATTCEALWMGVPVVSLAGRAHVSRVGAGILTQVGLGDLAAETVDGVVAAAVRLAGDVQALRDLRLAMRERLLASPLLDVAGLVRRLERAYREAWVRQTAM